MKKFLIIGNMNAISYKEVFPLIKENKMWLGVSLNGTKCSFIVNEDYDGKNTYYVDGVKYAKINNAIWFTNLDHKKRHEELLLYKKYNAEEYPKYDNYDAIEVSRVTDIPTDYEGIMGVPITFLDKYCPSQFEIISASDFCQTDIEGWKGVSKEFFDLYYKQGNKGQISIGWPLPHYVFNGKAIVPYKRIFIKRL